MPYTFVRPSSYKIAGSKVPAASQRVRSSATKAKKPQAAMPALDKAASGGRLFRVGPMKNALEMTKTSPVRPPQPLPPSASVGKLRAVLMASPRLPTGHDFGIDVEGLVFSMCYVPYKIEWYEWSLEYPEPLFSATLDVVDKHGFGETGWATVLWEIYDKYAKTLGEGIKCYRDGKIWSDKGAEWLDGQLLGCALELSSRAKYDSGEKFNGELPMENVQEYRCVGGGQVGRYES